MLDLKKDSNTTSVKVKKNAELTVFVEKLAIGGMAIARIDNMVVFIDKALPGQKVRILIRRKKRNYAEASVVEVLEKSENEVEPFCIHEPYCGGCRWQKLRYDKQLEWKRKHVEEALEHIANLKNTCIHPIVPSPRTEFYRNKMEFTFSARRWFRPDEIADKSKTLSRDCGLGLHVQGAFDRVFNLEECYLESPEAVEILKVVRSHCLQSGLPAYDIKKHTGFWRFLVIREGKKTGQRLVNVITTKTREADAAIKKLATEVERLGCVTTFVHSINNSRAQVATGEETTVYWGEGTIEEQLGDLTFTISPNSFFQTNPFGAEKLYEVIVQCAALTGNEVVWDMYCGTGSIALYLASKARKVVGFEIIEQAVADAYRNAERNSITNCSFLAGDIKDIIKNNLADRPDVVISDPPRAGMHPSVLKALLDLKPGLIIMVSCNPATFARDLGILSEKYVVTDVFPFDMFPHTPHIECIARLEKKSTC